jgi:hypothetical protein
MVKNAPIDMSQVTLPKLFTCGDDDGCKKKMHSSACPTVKAFYSKNGDEFPAVQKGETREMCSKCQDADK